MRRYTDEAHGFGDVMPTATVHIRPVHEDDTALKITTYEHVGYEVGTYARTVMITATTEAAVLTAAYISVPASSIVVAKVSATYGASAGAGTYSVSGGRAYVEATLVASGASVLIQNTFISGVATADDDIGVALSAHTTGNYVPICLKGLDNNNITWMLDIETTTIIPENNLQAKVNI
jgi:hypothetical protein